MSKQTARVAIMTKGSFIACVAIDMDHPAADGSTVNAVGSMDPRCNPARHLRAFISAEDAEQQYHQALATSRDHGWTVAHVGPRNFG